MKRIRAEMKKVKIISKNHSFHHINQKTGELSKRPKSGAILLGQKQLQKTTTQDILRLIN